MNPTLVRILGAVLAGGFFVAGGLVKDITAQQGLFSVGSLLLGIVGVQIHSIQTDGKVVAKLSMSTRPPPNPLPSPPRIPDDLAGDNEQNSPDSLRSRKTPTE